MYVCMYVFSEAARVIYYRKHVYYVMQFYEHARICVHTHIHTYADMCVLVPLCMCVCTRTHLLCVQTCKYILTRTHTHIHRRLKLADELQMWDADIICLQVRYMYVCMYVCVC
jgi:hypothetical protein